MIRVVIKISSCSSLLKSGTVLEQVGCHQASPSSQADGSRVQMVAHVKSGW